MKSCPARGYIRGLVAADRVLAPDEEHSGQRFARTGMKCVQEGYNSGVGGCNTESDGSGDGESDYKSNQQTPQVRPTLPVTPAARKETA